MRVAVAAGPSTTHLASSAESLTWGAPVTSTATVMPSASSAPVTGTVVVRVDDTVIATQPVTDGAASVTVSGLDVGDHRMVARYSGDGGLTPSAGRLKEHVRCGLEGLSPHAEDSFPVGATVPVIFRLTDAAGRPIPDDRARALVRNKGCQVEVTFTGALSQPASCAAYGQEERQLHGGAEDQEEGPDRCRPMICRTGPERSF